MTSKQLVSSLLITATLGFIDLISTTDYTTTQVVVRVVALALLLSLSLRVALKGR